jgi:hypothetical protein
MQANFLSSLSNLSSGSLLIESVLNYLDNAQKVGYLAAELITDKREKGGLALDA